MTPIILACRNLKLHLEKAQEAMHTQIPVIELDTSLHKEPEKMREKILEEIQNIPEKYDTILVAMGFCGGSWKDVAVNRTIVIPKMDDCITMLLTLSDVPNANLKHSGRMYLTDNRDDGMTIPGIRDSLIAEYGEKKGNRIFDLWFDSYRMISIIDTGIYDSYDPDFIAFAKESARLIDGEIEHVPGSNLVLEKLLSQRWDDQFFVLKPGQTITEEDLLG